MSDLDLSVLPIGDTPECYRVAEPSAVFRTFQVLRQTFVFSAKCSRLRGSFVPRRHTYSNFHDPDANSRPYRPYEPARLCTRRMMPNFLWREVHTDLLLMDRDRLVTVRLTVDLKPNGHIVPDSWSCGIIGDGRAFAAGSSIIREFPNGRVILFGEDCRYRRANNRLLPDIRFENFDGTKFDFVPRTNFDTWNRKQCPLRYYNNERVRRQPPAGFSAKQFVQRYCGGGFQCPGADVHEFYTIGSSQIMKAGMPFMRKRRGWNQYPRTI